MRKFYVAQGTKARLINRYDKTEHPYVVRQDITLTDDDIKIDPEIVLENTGIRSSEFGFAHGDHNQRRKYILMIDISNMEIEES